MAKIFGIISAVVLGLCGIVAYKNNEKYELEISNTDSEKVSLAKEKTRLKTAEDNLKKTSSALKELETTIAQTEQSVTAQSKKNDDLKQALEAKTTKATASKQELEQIREKTAKIGDISELAGKMRSLTAELGELNQTVTTAEAKLADLTAQNKRCESQVTTLKQKFESISSGQSVSTLNTKIRSIYPNWGFVTLSAGGLDGIVSNSTLEVVRGDATVAKLLVTSVESKTAAASVIPDSMANDTTLMIGDRVIASSQKSPTARN
jgi:predicted  nucleic acid-binding Zn-ribbon protein